MAILKNSRVIFHDTRVDLDATNIEMEVNAEGVDNATLNQDTRTVEAGLKSTLVSVSGIFNNASNEHLTSQVDLTDVPITIIPENGTDAFIMNANTFGSGWGGAIGEQATFNLQAIAKTQSVKGKVLANKTFSSVEIEDGVHFSAIKDKLVVNIHTVACAGPPWPETEIYIERSSTSDFSSFFGIHTQIIAGVESIFVEIDNASNEAYYRVSHVPVSSTAEREIIVALGFRGNDVT